MSSIVFQINILGLYYSRYTLWAASNNQSYFVDFGDLRVTVYF